MRTHNVFSPPKGGYPIILPFRPLSLGILISLLLSPRVEANGDLYFDPSLLNADVSQVADLDWLTKGNEIAPGKYSADIYLNRNFINRMDVVLTPGKESGTVTPCLSEAQIRLLSVNTKAFPALVQALNENACVDITQYIQDSRIEIDTSRLRLNISIPQVALNKKTRGFIPPERWENGVNALLLNYDFSGANTRYDDHQNDNNYFLNLRSRLNFGPWRLHNYSTWRYSDSGRNDNKWSNLSTYLERPLIKLRSNFVIGDSFSSGDVFDSFGFRGIGLASDDNMLPDSQKGFAPTVSGIAQSNARVTIRQNNNVIYETYVPPGAFNITDLYPTSASGDLQVTIHEADGSERSYTVPYSTVPLLQRDGHRKFAFMAGEFHQANSKKRQLDVAQGSWIQGMPHGYTLYGGSIVAEDYKSAAFGAGKNLGRLGALSLDVTQANSKLVDGSKHQGQSYRLRYAKSLNSIGTNLQLLGSRYSTKGFYNFSEVASNRIREDDNGPSGNAGYDLNYVKKNNVQLSLSQNISSFGTAYTTMSRQTYWHTPKKNDLMQVGFSTNIASAMVNLAYSHSRTPWNTESDKIINLSVSVPLHNWISPKGTSRHPMYFTANSNTNARGSNSSTVGINGSLLENNNLSYSVRQGLNNRGGGSNMSASADYDGRYGNVNAAYSVNKDSRQLSYGVSGGAVFHRNGLVLSQPLGETNVLVHAEGTYGTGIENAAGVKTNWAGYAIVPYATNYRLNRIALDTTSLKDDTEVEEPVTEVVPTRGALVLARFNTRVGFRVLFKLKHPQQEVPFGAIAAVKQGSGSDTNSSIVSDGGTVYFSGLEEKGVINVTWGKTPDKQCQAQYDLRQAKKQSAVQQLTVRCL
ncbi:outer membrane usher protein [Enterobacillus tribolii]|uniref:Outer membrane usher protein n=1 Tax=Enterobacillus tribolii TaxID=1487935 RepID=A0A370QNW1_9GAMM|nr:outer membrane usher protein [Enterobacillus tribolii]